MDPLDDVKRKKRKNVWADYAEHKQKLDDEVPKKGKLGNKIVTQQAPDSSHLSHLFKPHINHPK